MAALPKKKTSKERQGKRRRAIKLEIKSLTKCTHCGQKTLPHNVCQFCGWYKGKLVKKVEEKTKVTKVA